MYQRKEYLHPEFHSGYVTYGCIIHGGAVLTPPRRVGKNVSLCFSICILLQAEQKAAAIRHTTPEMKSALLSMAACREAHALVMFPCPLSEAT